MKLSEVKEALRAFICDNLSGIASGDFAFEDEAWDLEPGKIKIREAFIGSDDTDVTDEAYASTLSFEYDVFQNGGINLVDDIIFDLDRLFKFKGASILINDSITLSMIRTRISPVRDANYRGRALLVFFTVLNEDK